MGNILSSIFNKSYVHFEVTENIVPHPLVGEFLVLQDEITGNLVYALEVNLRELDIQDHGELERHQLFSHSNILRFEGFKKLDDNTYLTLYESFEYTLAEEIQARKEKNSRFTENEILSLLQNISSALAYFQKKEIYHGQVTPDNIVKKGEDYKLIDPVLFDNYQSTYDRVLEEENVSLARLLSPELLEVLENKDLDPVFEPYKQDIYALGVIILDAIVLDTSMPLPRKFQFASDYSKPLMQVLNQMVEENFSMRIDSVSCSKVIENIYYGFPITDDSDPTFMTNELKNQVKSVLPAYYDLDISPNKSNPSPLPTSPYIKKKKITPFNKLIDNISNMEKGEYGSRSVQSQTPEIDFSQYLSAAHYTRNDPDLSIQVPPMSQSYNDQARSKGYSPLEYKNKEKIMIDEGNSGIYSDNVSSYKNTATNLTQEPVPSSIFSKDTSYNKPTQGYVIDHNSIDKSEEEQKNENLSSKPYSRTIKKFGEISTSQISTSPLRKEDLDKSPENKNQSSLTLQITPDRNISTMKPSADSPRPRNSDTTNEGQDQENMNRLRTNTLESSPIAHRPSLNETGKSDMYGNQRDIMFEGSNANIYSRQASNQVISSYLDVDNIQPLSYSTSPLHRADTGHYTPKSHKKEGSDVMVGTLYHHPISRDVSNSALLSNQKNTHKQEQENFDLVARSYAISPTTPMQLKPLVESYYELDSSKPINKLHQRQSSRDNLAMPSAFEAIISPSTLHQVREYIRSLGGSPTKADQDPAYGLEASESPQKSYRGQLYSENAGLVQPNLTVVTQPTNATKNNVSNLYETSSQRESTKLVTFRGSYEKPPLAEVSHPAINSGISHSETGLKESSQPLTYTTSPGIHTELSHPSPLVNSNSKYNIRDDYQTFNPSGKNIPSHSPGSHTDIYGLSANKYSAKYSAASPLERRTHNQAHPLTPSDKFYEPITPLPIQQSNNYVTSFSSYKAKKETEPDVIGNMQNQIQTDEGIIMTSSFDPIKTASDFGPTSKVGLENNYTHSGGLDTYPTSDYGLRKTNTEDYAFKTQSVQNVAFPTSPDNVKYQNYTGGSVELLSSKDATGVNVQSSYHPTDYMPHNTVESLSPNTYESKILNTAGVYKGYLSSNYGIDSYRAKNYENSSTRAMETYLKDTTLPLNIASGSKDTQTQNYRYSVKEIDEQFGSINLGAKSFRSNLQLKQSTIEEDEIWVDKRLEQIEALINNVDRMAKNYSMRKLDRDLNRLKSASKERPSAALHLNEPRSYTSSLNTRQNGNNASQLKHLLFDASTNQQLAKNDAPLSHRVTTNSMLRATHLEKNSVLNRSNFYDNGPKSFRNTARATHIDGILHSKESYFDDIRSRLNPVSGRQSIYPSPMKRTTQNLEAGSERKTGYALEIMRNQMKHYFLSDMDNFIEGRLTSGKKKQNSRVSVLQQEIEKIQTAEIVENPKIASDNEYFDQNFITPREPRSTNKASRVPLSHRENVATTTEYKVEEYGDGSRYEGEMQGDLRHGQGVLIDKEGATYDGNWKLDRMDGYGVLLYPNNKVLYEGEWRNNTQEGKGTLYNQQVVKLIGDYTTKQFDKSDGTWAKYEGDIKGGKWHGFGKLTFSNGNIYQGMFRKDTLHGRGHYTVNEKRAVIGEWHNNSLVEIL